MNYEFIKKLSKETGRNIPDLCAMSAYNDPFYAGSPAQRRDAEWFATVWERFNFSHGAHVRRCHYIIASDHNPPVCPNGKLYTNTSECWDFIGAASRGARYLGLVDPTAFVDRRNPDPAIYAMLRQLTDEPSRGIEQLSWTLPTMWIQLESRLNLPKPFVVGYEYELADQRYHLEVWVEKSTVDDVLEPLCREFGAVLVTGIGYQSITSVITMLRRRVNVHGKPTRVFYVSDFDPAGEHMPVAVARQVEFWRREHAPDEEIKLIPLVLSREQVIHYRLPRIPIKESDLRKKGFEGHHGQGACELDALEALHPGELARIVTAAIKPYIDASLDERLDAAYNEAMDVVEDAWSELVEPEAEELKALKADANVIARKHQPAATKLQKSFEADMKPIQARLDVLQHAVEKKARQFKVDLPDRPQAATANVDESGWMFDSNRSYLEQLACYQRYKGTPNGGSRKRKGAPNGG